MLKHVYNVDEKFWINLRNRRLQNWGSLPEAEEAFKPLCPWLRFIAEKTLGKQSCIFPNTHPINHCLINEYKRGQGILPHMDGPRYYPQVLTISLGSPCILSFYKHFRNREKVGKGLSLPPHPIHMISSAQYYLSLTVSNT